MVIVETMECHVMASTSFQINRTPKYDQITELVPQLYIWLTSDNMKKYNISLIINATAQAYFFFASIKIFHIFSK